MMTDATVLALALAVCVSTLALILLWHPKGRGALLVDKDTRPIFLTRMMDVHWGVLVLFLIFQTVILILWSQRVEKRVSDYGHILDHLISIEQKLSTDGR
jgi:hypothetical protein